MSENSQFTAIRSKVKLPQLILENIKKAIVSGELIPGDKLPSISELASQMGVGISSVREAIKMLEILDVLEVKQGEGTFIANGSKEIAAVDASEGSAFNALSLQMMLMPHTAENLVEFRRMYETSYSHLALENATNGDLEELEEIVKSQESSMGLRYPTADDEREFHKQVLKCTHNPYVITLGEILLELFMFTNPSSGTFENPKTVSMDHRNILEAMKKKDIKALDKILEKSFVGWEQRIKGEIYVETEHE